MDSTSERNRLTRRRLLGLGVVAAIGAACAPAATSPAATTAAAPVPTIATAAAATRAATAAPTAPPATPSPARTPFNIASMKDPLIDDHAHPIPPTQGDQAKYFDGIVDLMDKSNVAMTILHRNGEWTTGTNKWGAEHDTWVKAAMDRHPGRLLGFLAGFDPADPSALAYIRSQFQSAPGRWKAIGELDLRNPGPQTKIPINSPNVLAIAKLAGDLGVPFVFHYNIDYGTSGPEAGLAEIEDALVKVPGTTFVIAHNPLPPPMQKHTNLWAELTLYAPQGVQVFQMLSSQQPAFLDRFVLCLTDMQQPDLRVSAGAPAPMSYAEATTKARDALAALTAEQRDKIAYKNLTRLLKLS